MALRRVEISKNVHISAIIDRKFTTNSLSYYFARPLNRKEATLNALLPQVLAHGNTEFPRKIDLVVQLEQLFGANLSGKVQKVGKWHLFGLTMDYVSQPDTLSIDRLLETSILQPFTQNGVFSEEYFLSERQKLEDWIMARKNDKIRYAYDRAIELAFEGSEFSVQNLGYIDELSELTPKSLWNHYQNILKSSRIEIFYCGADERNLSILEQKFANLSTDIQISFSDNSQYFGEDIKEYSEQIQANQTNAVILYNTGLAPNDERVFAANVASCVYGGGTSSKLFNQVREKMGLCYHTFALHERSMSAIVAQSAVDPSEARNALDAMLSEWRKMSDVTNEELRDAKTSLIRSFRAQNDTPRAIENFWISQIFNGTNYDLADYEQKTLQISKKDVVKIAGQIKPAATYFLQPIT